MMKTVLAEDGLSVLMVSLFCKNRQRIERGSFLRRKCGRFYSGGKPPLGLTFSACQPKVRNLPWP